MISAVILTKNEEKNIKTCIKNLLWANEIIIVDDYSSDNTIKIAKKLKVKIYKRHLDNNFSAQRNFALAKARYEWVFFVDADEIVTKNLQKEIFNSQFTNLDAYFIQRNDFFLGKRLRFGETNIKLIRLGKKKRGKWKRKVHEYWNIKGRFDILKNALIHYPHISLKEFIADISKYSEIHANENKKEGKKSNIFKIVFFPLAKFINNYFLKLGFLDGTEGFIMGVMMSFHSFLSWSKQWIN